MIQLRTLRGNAADTGRLLADPGYRGELPDDWLLEAKCRGIDTHWDDITTEMCDGCPVVAQCADLYVEVAKVLRPYAHSGIQVAGVWGGEDRHEEAPPRYSFEIEPCGHMEGPQTRGACKGCYDKQRKAAVARGFIRCITDGCNQKVYGNERRCFQCYKQHEAAKAPAKPPCTLDDCDVPQWSLGLCRRHYDADWRRRKREETAA